MAEPETQEPQVEAQAAEADGVEVQEAELPEAEGGSASAGGGQIDVLLDTTLLVEVRLGEVQTLARDLLRLGPGSVLQLDNEVGEPVDLLLRGNRFATGQIVVVGDHLGVRIKEIISPRSAE